MLNSYERAAELFFDGLTDPAAFVSDWLPLADYKSAIDRVRRGIGGKILVLRQPDHAAAHSDIALAGFDVGLALLLLGVAVAAWRRSPWLEGATS